MSALIFLVTLFGADSFDRRCLATDDEGSVLAEAVDEDALACRERVKAQLAARWCVGGRKSLPYRYQRGRGRAVASVLYCHFLQ